MSMYMKEKQLFVQCKQDSFRLALVFVVVFYDRLKLTHNIITSQSINKTLVVTWYTQIHNINTSIYIIPLKI